MRAAAQPLFHTPKAYVCVCRSPLWGSLRAGAQPLFHHQSLTAYSSIINKSVDRLIANLQAAAAAGKQVDILQQLGQMTMQVTGAAAFG